MRLGKSLLHVASRLRDGNGINQLPGRGKLVGQRGDVRQHQRQRGQTEVHLVLEREVQDLAEGLREHAQPFDAGFLAAFQVREHHPRAQALRGLPLVELVGVLRCQERELFVGLLDLQAHRRAEAAKHRGDHRGRALRNSELKHLLRLGELKDGRRDDLVARVLVQQAHFHGDEQRQLLRLVRRRRGHLRQLELVDTSGGVQLAACRHDRRAGLKVPALELRQILPVGVRHGGAEVITGHSAAIVALEVKVHALAEAILAEEDLVHADHLSALLVDGDRVEVVHGDVAVWPNRVGQRPRVLHELPASQHPHVTNALDRLAGAHVRRERLVTVDGEALLQRELEPVSASHAIPSPAAGRDVKGETKSKMM
eukprot:scaffold53_cov193-Pinguiococcus_pyrenoidosus.AAC.63